MSELHVQPKKSNPWWLWLLLALIALALLFLFLKGCNNKDGAASTADSTSTSGMADTSAGSTALAVTEPDWNSVDFNAPKTSDPDVTDQDITVSGTEQYTIYTLGENILFATDQNSVQGSAEGKLKQIVASLNKRFKGAAIAVYGNTDSTGTAGHNKELGAQRAEAVKNWLVSNGQIADDKVSIRSFGENKPVASNASSAGREQNRNVQIVAFPNGNAQ